MSAGTGGRGQEVELNLAPIIDCFTVLIAFMLVSASFLSIGILDAGVAAAIPNPKNTPPPVSIEILLKADSRIQIKISGKENRTIHTDFEQLRAQLEPIHARWKGIAGATISAENPVEYKTVIRTMETTRKIFPAVALGGI